MDRLSISINVLDFIVNSNYQYSLLLGICTWSLYCSRPYVITRIHFQQVYANRD